MFDQLLHDKTCSIAEYWQRLPVAKATQQLTLVYVERLHIILFPHAIYLSHLCIGEGTLQKHPSMSAIKPYMNAIQCIHHTAICCY